ncbi:MAG: ribosome small subunit-dependent GTPase, partial [Christensenellales bacterium]
MIGKVVKNIADKFSVVGCDGEIIENCSARGNLKVNGKVLVGDNVEYEVNQGQAIITRIEKRRNEFIRPSISNIDIMLIVISEVPSVDLLLLDKLILCCKLKNV